MNFNPDKCPTCDSDPVHIVERLYCAALLTERDENGEFTYAGQSDVNWDGQEMVAYTETGVEQILTSAEPELIAFAEWVIRCASMRTKAGTAYFISDEAMACGRSAVARARNPLINELGQIRCKLGCGDHEWLAMADNINE